MAPSLPPAHPFRAVEFNNDYNEYNATTAQYRSPQRRVGVLHMILGPMFAGKTSEMLRRVQRQKIAMKRCLVIKYAKDTRYSATHVSTHDKLMMVANPTTMLADLDHLTKDVDVIGIDEGQFYPDLFDQVEKYVKEGKHVIMAALDGTFERRPFDAVNRLVPLSDFLVKLNAVCVVCFQDAPFTQRLTRDSEVEMIGGAELYRPVCRQCYDEGEGEKGKSGHVLKREDTIDSLKPHALGHTFPLSSKENRLPGSEYQRQHAGDMSAGGCQGVDQVPVLEGIGSTRLLRRHSTNPSRYEDDL